MRSRRWWINASSHHDDIADIELVDVVAAAYNDPAQHDSTLR